MDYPTVGCNKLATNWIVPKLFSYIFLVNKRMIIKFVDGSNHLTITPKIGPSSI
jgi:hypothetical protein